MNNLLNIGMQKNLTYSYKKHKHLFWEITYYYEGEGVNLTDNIAYNFKAGTIICQPPNLEHEDISKSGYKNIFFCVGNFSFNQNEVIFLHDTSNNDFLYILKQLYNEFYNLNPDEMIKNTLLNLLFQYMCKLKETTAKNAFVAEIERAIITNISNEEFNLDEAIKKIPICKDHFRRLFKQEFLLSPLDYLNKMRIEYSQKLLKNSNITIKDTAHMSGFSDPYYFSRYFKKKVGCSPNLWRRTSNAYVNHE